MSYIKNAKIVTDSCCDMSSELKERLGVVTVPFAMDLGCDHYTDDSSLNLEKFKEAVTRWQGRIGTAAPSPHSFYETLKKTGAAFCLTISSRLSASYENAQLAAKMLDGEHRVHVFDSLSASAGETLATIKLRQLIEENLSEVDIIGRLEQFIKGMKTYFVLESIDNLLKNGRLNRITGKLTSLLHIKPLLGADGHGQIKLFGQARGRKQIINKLLNTIAHSNRKITGETLVISHCDNPSLASELAEQVKLCYDFAEVLVVPTSGLSSVYADKDGIVMAY